MRSLKVGGDGSVSFENHVENLYIGVVDACHQLWKRTVLDLPSGICHLFNEVSDHGYITIIREYLEVNNEGHAFILADTRHPSEELVLLW